MKQVSVRPLRAEDDLVFLTELIHAAYAPHASEGLRYWATHQSVADTAKRCAIGRAFIAELAGEIAGTITLREPQPDSPVPLYRSAGVWSFAQFAVAPHLKGRGVGVALHEHVLAVAAANGAHCIALDTAAPAVSLIAMYESWGYTLCGECDWRPHTNYLSVLMSRQLTPLDAARSTV